jgi:sterol desaturase/sphingolipid hydroxylase (fatty acid hydroxylase superfamily)
MSTGRARCAAVSSYAVYPVVAGAAVALLLLLVADGRPYWPVATAVLAGTAVVVTGLERWRPHAVVWQRNHGDLRVDLVHLAGNVAVSQAATLSYGAAYEAGWLGDIWPTSLPFGLQFLAGLLIVDLGLYAVHRASHGVGWLWQLHVIHHSAPRLYWVNGQRRHLLHEVIEGLPGLLALGLIGAPGAVVGCAFAAVTIHLLLQHGNVEYRGGWLRHVFAVAELHRWHHQPYWRDVQGNYGAVFSIWDRLFGTALPQTGDAPIDVGMDDEPDLPASWRGQLLWPFRGRQAVAGGNLRHHM